MLYDGLGKNILVSRYYMTALGTCSSLGSLPVTIIAARKMGIKEEINELALFLDHFQCFSMAYSWGGYESLILATQPEELNAIRPAGKVHFSGTLIRLHIGLEDVQDLIDDLKAGFDRINH